MPPSDFDVWVYLAQVAPVVVVMAVVGRIMYSYFIKQLEKLEEQVNTKDLKIEELNEKRIANDKETILTLQRFSGLMDRMMELQKDGSLGMMGEIKDQATAIKKHVDVKINELKNALR